MKKMLAFLLALLMGGMTGAAFAEGSTIIHQDGDPDFDAMTIEQWEQYEVPCPKPSHPSTFSFLNLYEYTLSSSRPSFPKEYGLKAARRAPQFSKRRSRLQNDKKPWKRNGFRGFSFLILLFPFEEI